MLPIGSIVYLSEGTVKMMILNRGAFVEQDGNKVVFDYTGALYPIGFDELQVYYFNDDDIGEVVLEGFKDDEEKRFINLYDTWRKKNQSIPKGKTGLELGEYSILLDEPEIYLGKFDHELPDNSPDMEESEFLSNEIFERNLGKVENKYDKYLIRDLRRINSRYYLIKINRKSYIWDFFDLKDFRNYYPFKVFYPKKNSWKLYDVTGEILNYKAKKNINFYANKGFYRHYPFTFDIEASLFLIGVLTLRNLVALLLTLAILLLLTIIGLKRINKVDVEEKPQYILKIAKLENRSLWERKIAPIIVVTLFSIIFIFGLADLIPGGFWSMCMILFFFGSFIIFWGTMRNDNFIPKINIKYQIKDKKEN